MVAEVDYMCYPSRGGTDGLGATFYSGQYD